MNTHTCRTVGTEIELMYGPYDGRISTLCHCFRRLFMMDEKSNKIAIYHVRGNKAFFSNDETNYVQRELDAGRKLTLSQ